ncbi:MAG: hypothetical protein RBG13Loki_3809 [Promethearchaeota archaeon CR_4]|nr:MAG: hypothetical protein RBG13Loki_3809 [Candidatus Lokiarchaeota archaeon CR_4]
MSTGNSSTGFKISQNLDVASEEFKVFLQTKFDSFKDETPPTTVNADKPEKTIVSQDAEDFLEELKNVIDLFTANFGTGIIENLFGKYIESWIEFKPKKGSSDFLDLKSIYEVFFNYGLRIIHKKEIEKLIGALQWNNISPFWIKTQFLLDYLKTLPKDTPKDHKKIVWILIELVRIKIEETNRREELLKASYIF